MTGHTKYLLTLGLAWSLSLATPISWADNITIPNTFVSGNKAMAAEVNDNFAAVATGVNDNDHRIAVLEAEIADLQYFIKLLQNDLNVAYNKVERLENDLVDVDTSSSEVHDYLKQYGYLPEPESESGPRPRPRPGS